MPIAQGSRYSPAVTTEAPYPKPVLRGSWASCGSSRNHAYSPAPTRKAARLAVHTPRTRIIVMSMSGLLLCSSTSIHTLQAARPNARSTSVFGPVQPQVVVWAIAISTADRPALIRAAAVQFTRPGSGPATQG